MRLVAAIALLLSTLAFGAEGQDRNGETATTAYTPSTTYQYNGFSTGNLTALGYASHPGQYQVAIPGTLSYTKSLALVTAYGGGSDYCNISSWDTATNHIFIACYNQGGNYAASQFDAAFQSGN